MVNRGCILPTRLPLLTKISLCSCKLFHLLLLRLLNPKKDHYHNSTLPPRTLMWISKHFSCRLGILQHLLLSANSTSYAPTVFCKFFIPFILSVFNYSQKLPTALELRLNATESWFFLLSLKFQPLGHFWFRKLCLWKDFEFVSLCWLLNSASMILQVCHSQRAWVKFWFFFFFWGVWVITLTFFCLISNFQSCVFLCNFVSFPGSVWSFY